jgi:hypothetical protein
MSSSVLSLVKRGNFHAPGTTFKIGTDRRPGLSIVAGTQRPSFSLV